MKEQHYLTLKGPVSAELKIRGSRFIGSALPVLNEKEAESFLERVSAEYHDATHHCYAFRLGSGDRSVFRMSDDGEPAGTAGRPILEAMNSLNMSDLICVVTRYFGGTKLGTGGLFRAYSSTAKKILSSGKTLPVFPVEIFHITYPYELTGKIHILASQSEGKILRTKYGSETEITVQIRKASSEEFVNQILDVSSGKVRIRKGDPA